MIYERNVNNAQKFYPEIRIKILLIAILGINYSHYSNFFPKRKKEDYGEEYIKT